MIPDVEQELIEASGFEPEKNYKDRQDYLAALLLATADELSDDDFEKLTNEAKNWCNEAARCRKARKPIKDFDNGGTEHTSSEPVEVQGEGESSTETEPSKKAVPAKPKRAKKPKKEKHSGEVDKFGCAVGTKASAAAALFAKGVTMKEVKDTVGDTFYNLLKRMKAAGHRVEKDGDKYTLTAKQDLV